MVEGSVIPLQHKKNAEPYHEEGKVSKSLKRIEEIVKYNFENVLVWIWESNGIATEDLQPLL